MDNWGVYLVILSLLGFLALVIPPVVRLNTSITKLTVTLEQTCGDLAGLSSRHDEDMKKNSESHTRLWAHNNKQDEKLIEHDKRIHTLERKDI